MDFDGENHLALPPSKLVRLARTSPLALVNDGFLVATPRMFATRADHRAFLAEITTRLGVHPLAATVRGSGLLGYSIAPKPHKLWKPISASSDVDLAIVDSDHYHFLDSQVRAWERSWIAGDPRPVMSRLEAVRENRRNSCHRYMDLPDQRMVTHYMRSLDGLA